MAQPSVSLTSVSISKSEYTADAVSIASAYLEAETEDYYFFQYADDVFVLLVGELDYINGSVSADSCSAVVIWRVGSSVNHSDMLPFHGSQSGSYAGSDGSGAFNGIVDGNTTFAYTQTTYNYFVATDIVQNVSVYNPDDCLVYSSFPNTCHLIEGVQNYAYAAFMLAVGIIVYRLADKLFRRVY